MGSNHDRQVTGEVWLQNLSVEDGNYGRAFNHEQVWKDEALNTKEAQG